VIAAPFCILLSFLQTNARKSKNNIHTFNLHHVNPKADTKNTKKIDEANLHHKLPKGRPKDRWKCDVENDIRKTGIVNWREVAQDRDGWRRATGEDLILLG
jgi:hypothetical protein